jgi:hypothetical protein
MLDYKIPGMHGLSLFAVIFHHVIDICQAFLLLFSDLFQLLGLVFQSLVDPSIDFSFLENFLELTDDFSLPQDTFGHEIHFLQFLLLEKELFCISEQLMVEVSLIFFNFSQVVHPEC